MGAGKRAIACREVEMLIPQEVFLTNNGDYTFSGEVVFPPGQTSIFTIETEDLAGTKQTKTLSIMFSN